MDAFELDLEFEARDRAGRVRVTMHRNDDPVSTGHDQISKTFDADLFVGSRS